MRQSWDGYFIELTKLVASRATCCRKKFGCVLTKNNRIIATGYNGAPKGLPHCLDVGCLMVNSHCVRTIHAEVNALLQAGNDAEGSTLYVSGLPCANCLKLILQCGVKRVVFIEAYRPEDLACWSDAFHNIDFEIWDELEHETLTFDGYNEFIEYLNSLNQHEKD